MRILAIDTSTQAGGVAIIEDDRLLVEFILNVTSTHSRRILSSIDIAYAEVLRSAIQVIS